MFSFLTSYKMYIEIVVVLSIIAIISYGAHKILEHERKLGYDTAVAEYTKKELISIQAARDKESELNHRLQEANNVATLREQKIAVLSDKLSDTSRGLLNTINTLRNKLSQSSVAASRQQADTALALLGECQRDYSEMAENADRHASDVTRLEEAWPN